MSRALSRSKGWVVTGCWDPTIPVVVFVFPQVSPGNECIFSHPKSVCSFPTHNNNYSACLNHYISSDAVSFVDSEVTWTLSTWLHDSSWIKKLKYIILRTMTDPPTKMMQTNWNILLKSWKRNYCKTTKMQYWYESIWLFWVFPTASTVW